MWIHLTAVLFITLVVDGVRGAAISNTTTNISIENLTSPQEIASKFPYYLSGFDYENRPIYVMELGKWDIKTTVEAGGKNVEDLEKHVDQYFSRLSQAGKHYLNGAEYGSEDVVTLLDWEDFSMLQLVSPQTLQLLLRHFAKFQKLQSVLAYGFCVNVNAVARSTLNLLKPVMGSVMERIEVYGTQKESWVPKLLRKIPKNQIPPWYGDELFVPVAVFG